MRREEKFWYQWIAFYSIGEMLGIGTAAMVARFLLIEYSQSTYTSSTVLTALVLILAGTIEGLIIGYVQWKSLSKLVTDFTPTRWITITTLASISGWLFILPPAVIVIFFFSQHFWLGNPHSILFTIITGLAFGGLIGMAQYSIIKKFFNRALTWVLATAIGWSLSFVFVYTALSLFSSPLYNIMLIAVACILSGLTQGLVNSTAVHLILRIKKEYERSIPY